ncbi:MAG: helix-turn-helix domain-containing protein [Deltaproteobacteria bacterium]|nr:helix-turn-helix domain-containing protein [Deltaproteobacteria bacterium]
MGDGGSVKRSMRVDELAARWDVHPATVYRMIRRKELPAFKAGANLRIPMPAVEAREKVSQQ